MQPKINNQQKSFRRLFLVSCAAFGVLFVFYCLYILYSILSFKETRFIADRYSPLDTVQAFAYSLAYNRLDKVKTYVSEDKWTFIDSWDSIHEQVEAGCKFWDNPSGIDWIGAPDQESNIYGSAYWIRYKCPHYSYTFFVDVKLIWTNKGWEITEWTDICETKGSDEKCYE